MIETGTGGQVRLSLLSPRAMSRAAVPAAGFLISVSNEPSAVLARAFGECREGHIPRCSAAGLLTSADCEIWGLPWQNIRK